MELHSLLQRQLKRCSIDILTCSPAMHRLVDLVNEAYRQSDSDRAMLERALDLSSQELVQANTDMRGALEALSQARDELERRVEERTAELARANAIVNQSQKMDAVGRLAGGVAHDFNNLLTAIYGYAELLLEELGSDPRRQRVEEIRKNAERAGSLTRQLLAFSRRQLVTPRVFDLNARVADLDRLLNRLIGEDIRLNTSLSPSAGRVKADAGQLDQVILNLVVNARDAMPQGGQITIETFDRDVTGGDGAFAGVSAGSYVVIRVSDTGVGMDATVKAHIFEPFFTTKEAGKGTGLGLATVYGIVKQSNGFIVVESEPGQGATFTVLLPRVTETEVDARSAEKSFRVAQGTEVILLAEDEASVRGIAREVLQSHGYRVIETTSGVEAFHAASRARHIDLVLTDVVMPEMNGRELADRLRVSRPLTKVLFMTGYTDDAILTRGLNATSTPLLQKPFTPAALLRAVRDTLDGRPLAAL